MLQIFVNENTERIKYTFEFIFKDRGIPYEISTSKNDFEKKEGLKLYYTTQKTENFSIQSSNLLFDTSFRNYAIKKDNYHGIDCLSFNGISDPVASIFYILTRMEEYNSIQSDSFGRYLCKFSISYKNGWHKLAICDRWCEEIISLIEKSHQVKLKKKIPPVLAVPSFDIDNTYAYKFKGRFRTVLSIGKDILLGRKKRIIERKKVIDGSLRDPYDTFDKIYSLSELGLKSRVFWLLGDFSKYDKNLSFKNNKQKRLIQKMAEVCDIGIHPSVKSTEYEYYLHNELERLSDILNHEKILKARQHYLKIKIPETYRVYIQQEIEEDFTMGWVDLVGFRAGTARPHFWFDINNNRKTSLKVHPFVFMDGTLNQYMKIHPTDAIQEIDQLASEVKKYGGEFSFIWHNETIGDYGIWNGWTKVFKFSIQKCIDINEK